VQEWAQVAGNTFTIEEMPGDHFFLNTCRDALLTTISKAFTAGEDGKVDWSRVHARVK
jgi:surfactin synthase thioesterase subunit